jgi:hypothetical protein
MCQHNVPGHQDLVLAVLLLKTSINQEKGVRPSIESLIP